MAVSSAATVKTEKSGLMDLPEGYLTLVSVGHLVKSYADVALIRPNARMRCITTETIGRRAFPLNGPFHGIV